MNEPPTIRVLCVDDHEDTAHYYRIALKLEPDMTCVGIAATTEGLLELVEQARPTVVLLDLVIPGCDSLTALSSLRASFPDLVIVVNTGLQDPELVAEARKRGANAFHVKALELQDTFASIREAAARGPRAFMPPRGWEDATPPRLDASSEPA